MFEVIVGIVAFIGGIIAAIAGFGIGSLVTPVVAIDTGIGTAVAGVAIAHLLGTSVRFFYLRKHINRRITISFGLASAAGGLLGALLNGVFQNTVLTIIFGCMLIIAGISGITGIAEKIRFKGITLWLAGGVSGMLGGLVGNQGSIRSGALMTFGLSRQAFVATATAIALMVDLVRVPVYLATQWDGLVSIRLFILIAAAGVILGTFLGKGITEKLNEASFKKIVSGLVLLIGIWILIKEFV